MSSSSENVLMTVELVKTLHVETFKESATLTSNRKFEDFFFQQSNWINNKLFIIFFIFSLWKKWLYKYFFKYLIKNNGINNVRYTK